MSQRAASRQKRRKERRRLALSERFSRWWFWLTFGATVVLLVGFVYMSHRMVNSVHSEERFRLSEWSFGLAELPAWVTPEIRAQVEGAARNFGRGEWTIFDRGVIDFVRRQLESSTWVDRVDDIQIRYPTSQQPGRLHVALTLRRPVALVKYDDLYYLTDRRGRRLGAPYRESPGEWFGIPQVIGAQGGRGPAPLGERWKDQDVLEGVAVAVVLFDQGILREYPGPAVEAIDVTNLGGRKHAAESEIVLWWRGKRLTWGRSPLSTRAPVVRTELVLNNLRRVLDDPASYREFAEIHLHRREMTGVRG